MATGKHSATSCDVQFTYLILNWGIAQRGPAYVSVYSYAVPMLTALISFVIADDYLSDERHPAHPARIEE